jgi:hypothetical protein
MAGRFDGLTDMEWQLFADIFPTASLARVVSTLGERCRQRSAFPSRSNPQICLPYAHPPSD